MLDAYSNKVIIIVDNLKRDHSTMVIVTILRKKKFQIFRVKLKLKNNLQNTSNLIIFARSICNFFFLCKVGQILSLSKDQG